MESIGFKFGSYFWSPFWASNDSANLQANEGLIIIITEHLILRPKMQANSKAHAFLLPIIFSTEKDEFSAYS